MPDKRPPSYVLVLDGMKPVTVIDENDSCNPYYPGDRCGGCGECLMAQLTYRSDEQIQSYSAVSLRAVKYTRAWRIYDWAWYNTIERLKNYWWHTRLFALGVYTYGPVGYHKHRKQMKSFFDERMSN